MTQLQTNYVKILETLKEKIRHARLKVAVTVNTELIHLYWEIGYAIAMQEEEKGWGAKIVDKLAADLALEFPDMKGLSRRNLRYMRDFSLAYPQVSILQPTHAKSKKKEFLQAPLAKSVGGGSILQAPLAKLTWYHHIALLDKVKEQDARLFYMQKTIENGWSRNVMVQQIENNLFKRQGKSITNFTNTLPSIQSDLANETLKNPYVFDFLAMGEKFQERNFEKALIQHLKEFMLELGKGFAYVGNQKNLNVQGDDYFLDLLFYNYHLHCFVVFELKVGDFKPEYAGKLNFYVNTINEQLKSENDKPTIGVLLCKTPNETVIKYSLQNIKAPIGVSDYKLANALPKQLKAEMPTIEELEAELEKETLEYKSPLEKKSERLKELLKGLKEPPVKEKRNPKNSARIFNKVVLPLRDNIKTALNKIAKDFESYNVNIWLDGQGFNTDEEAQVQLKKIKEFNEYKIELRLEGFKPAGTKAFSIWKDISIGTNDYKYTIGTNRHHPQNIWLEKLYHELPDTKEFKTMTENFTETVLDDITQQVERMQGVSNK